jgi:hypothetical protein
MPDPLLHPSVYGAYFRRKLWERDGGKCGLCSKPVDLRVMHVDHIVPRCIGGPDTWENLQPAHRSCNYQKGANGNRKIRRVELSCVICQGVFVGIPFVSVYCSDPCRRKGRAAAALASYRAKRDAVVQKPKRRARRPSAGAHET